MKMRFELQLDCSNPAFDDANGGSLVHEMAYIFRAFADEVETPIFPTPPAFPLPFVWENILDSKGNVVGKWRFK